MPQSPREMAEVTRLHIWKFLSMHFTRVGIKEQLFLWRTFHCSCHTRDTEYFFLILDSIYCPQYEKLFEVSRVVKQKQKQLCLKHAPLYIVKPKLNNSKNKDGPFFFHLRSGHKTNCCGLMCQHQSNLQGKHKMECHKSHL